MLLSLVLGLQTEKNDYIASPYNTESLGSWSEEKQGDASQISSWSLAEKLEESIKEAWEAWAERVFEKAELNWPFQIDKVIDGDTIRVFINGQSERVRFVGLNTPEIWECFSYPAKDFINAKIGGSEVYLEFDASQGDFDKYGRYLAYVYSKEKENLNYALIASGYAREYTYASPYRYQSLFQSAEKSARNSNAGLWNDCK